MDENLRSLVTVPTQTASLLALPSFFRFLTRRARESGGRLILAEKFYTQSQAVPIRSPLLNQKLVSDHSDTYLLIKSLLKMILLNLASVLLARNLKNMV